MSEWEPDPGSPNGHQDWTRLRKKGRQALRLYYPDGRLFSQLGDTADATGKLFQLKSAIRVTRVSMVDGIASEENVGRAVHAHIIGLLDGLNGECVCFAWEPLPAPEPPPGLPRQPDPNDPYFLTGREGLFAEHLAKFQAAVQTYHVSPLFAEWQRQVKLWKFNGCGRVVGPFMDNVYQMRYQAIGAVNAEYLGIDDGEGR